MTQFEHGIDRTLPDDGARPGEAVSVHLQALLRLFGASTGNGRVLNELERTIAGDPVGYFNSPAFGGDMKEALETAFSSACLPELPVSIDEHVQHLQDKVFSRATPTASPRFVGHMTSALPSYLLPLAKIMTALNQNPVKLETSNAFTPLERQVLGMLHQLVFGCSEDFYRQSLQSGEHVLGAFCAGGTTANITALWASRNNLMPADQGFAGVAREGLASGLKHYGYDGLALLVSERGHYSLKKAADILGIGQDHLIAVPTDGAGRIRIGALQSCVERLRLGNIKPLALIGIAGTTETGAIDNLDAMADVAGQAGCHFHVDAAWGGASLMSDRQRPLFKGIERADSVVIDAHKQLYVPMGAGLVFFKRPMLATAISQHANYIVRKGSKDLGRHTLEGSRSAMAMLLYANLHILGRRGYEQLIDHGVDNARYFAELIKQQDDFELLSEPQLCLLTYRHVPSVIMQALRKADGAQWVALQDGLDALNEDIQERQRDAGRSFVSRTRLTPDVSGGRSICVLRVVLANPLTTPSILKDILHEQRALALDSRCLAPLLALLTPPAQSSAPVRG